MHDGIDDGLGDDLLGNLVFGGNLCAVLPRADPEVDFGEHEVFSLIDEIEDRALVNLIRGDRLGDLVTVKVGALHFGGREEALGALAEEQDRCMGGTPFIKEVQMGEDLVSWCISSQRKMAAPAGEAEEAGDFFFIQIVQRGIAAKCGIERTEADQFALLEDSNQAGVNRGDKVLGGLKAPPDKAQIGFADEALHLEMFRVVGGPFDKDQSHFAEAGGLVEFEMRGGKSVLIFQSVFIAEETEIEVAVPDFIEIDGFGSPVGCGDIALEEEGLEEAAQQRIARKIFGQGLTLGGEFLLHAADENLHHIPSCFRMARREASVSLASASMAFSSSTISAMGR